MRIKGLRDVAHTLILTLAVYPIVLLGLLALIYLGVFADQQHIPADTMPLVYGLVFAALTFFLVEVLGLASAVPAVISGINLIEYAQLVIPGRTASLIDCIAGLAGVFLAAVLIWVAHKLVHRTDGEPVEPIEEARGQAKKNPA